MIVVPNTYISTYIYELLVSSNKYQDALSKHDDVFCFMDGKEFFLVTKNQFPPRLCCKIYRDKNMWK